VICLATACATIESPRGGPADETPPVVVQVMPDSGTVGLVGLHKIEITFSEKVDPLPALRFVHFYPPLEIKSTKWHGRRSATVEFSDPLPPDTVIVVEIPSGHADVHRVASEHSRRYPLATADSLPPGAITGRLYFEDEPAAGAVVELYAVPPDSLEYFQQDILRRTEADSSGHFVLPWLVVPGGPYLLRAFQDRNGDLRPADNEPQRLLPVEIDLLAATPTADAGVHTLFDLNTPGRLLGVLDSLNVDERVLFGWTQKIADNDTGFVPFHLLAPPAGQAMVFHGDTTVFAPAGPGQVRAILFADLDGDSLLSALPDSVTLPDSLLWRWEPYITAEPLEIEPGLDLIQTLPSVSDSLRPCRAPPPLEPVAVDTLAPATAPPDTSGPAEGVDE